jgi:hypothetical protein
MPTLSPFSKAVSVAFVMFVEMLIAHFSGLGSGCGSGSGIGLSEQENNIATAAANINNFLIVKSLFIIVQYVT